MRRLRKALSRLWSLYFDGARWEADGGIYERLGVRRFSRLLLNGRYFNSALSRVRRRRYRVIHDRRSAQEWLLFTIVAEVGHGFFCIVMIVTAVLQAIDANWDRMATTTALNLVINVYPIMVQRYNRIRIARAFGLNAASVLSPAFWDSMFDGGLQPPEAR